MKPPVKGANVLYYQTNDDSCSARITRVNADNTVSLIVFPDDPTIGVSQGRQHVPYTPGVAGGWGWNEEFNSTVYYAGESLSGHWIVTLNANQQAVYPDLTSPIDIEKLVGMTIGSATEGRIVGV